MCEGGGECDVCVRGEGGEFGVLGEEGECDVCV